MMMMMMARLVSSCSMTSNCAVRIAW